MKNVFKLILAVVITTTIMLSGAYNVYALTLEEGAEAARCDYCPTDLFGENGVFRQITNTILYIVGIIGVIMLIWGGIRYALSGGDAKKVTDAKNTILYAIIGLVIAFLAFAIINFVITSLSTSETEETTSLLLSYPIYG